MSRNRVSLAACLLAVLASLLLFVAPMAQAQNGSPVLITQSVDESKLATLGGNTRPEANKQNDRGLVADSLSMEHMLLQLKRSTEQERALRQYIEELQDKSSPNFHHWLTAKQYGEKFGLAAQDLDMITRWLESHGFKVNVVYENGLLVDFSGTADQVQAAFHTEIHNLDVKGVKHIANMSDPKIPAALAPAVIGVVSMHDFKPHTNYKPRSSFTFAGCGTNCYAVVPGDLAVIYNLNPLFTAGTSGQGQTIVVVEDTDVYTTADWTTFRSTFGLSSFTGGSFTQVHPAPPSGTNNCSDPGVNGDDGEAILDAEYASAAAPSAAIELASCANTSTFGGLVAIQNLLNESTTPPSIISMSYGECEAGGGAAINGAFNSAFQQAVSEGVSVFVSSGDESAASCDVGDPSAFFGIGVSGWASTPYNVAVGGTDFGDTYAGTNTTYWNSTNTSTYESAISYVPEIPWDDSCASFVIWHYEGFPAGYGTNGFCNSVPGANFLNVTGGSGGPSGCATGTPAILGVVGGTCAGWQKPSWQSIVGNPSDNVRDIPDVSLFAANGVWGHFYPFCFSDPNGGAPCTGTPDTWAGGGGTSFSSPIMAGIQALVNQKVGSRQGNPNPVYYSLAAAEYGASGDNSCNSTNGNTVASSCIFYDVTLGDMDVNCSPYSGTQSFNCYYDGAFYGVLSTSTTSYAPAYATTVGWDFATGIGTVNAANLVNNWPGASSFTLSASPSTVTIVAGNNGTSTITVTPGSGFTGSVTLAASNLPSGVTAAFNPNPTTTTSTLTLTVSNTAGVGSTTITITGTSGSATATTTVLLRVAGYSLSASPSSVAVAQGSNATSTITVNSLNGFSGNVTLAASGLPSGVTAAFNPNPTATTSTLTLTASGSATAGTATVTVTGTSGSISATTTIALTVNQNFSFTAQPTTPGPAPAGETTTSTFTVATAGNAAFVNAVTFGNPPCNGLPDATVTCAISPIAQGASSPQQVTITITTIGPNKAGANRRRRADNRSPWLPLTLPLAGLVVVGLAGRKISKYSAVAGLCVSLVLIGLLIACGSSSTPPAVGVSVSPTAATVFASGPTGGTWPPQTATFTATVTNNTNTAVNWSVSPATGGSITSAGVYTAPTIAAGLPGSATITATSQADTTKTANATITITPTSVPGSYPLTVTATEGALAVTSSSFNLTVQ